MESMAATTLHRATLSCTPNGFGDILTISPRNSSFAGAANFVTGLGLNTTFLSDWRRGRGRDKVPVLRSTSTSSFSRLGKLSEHRDDGILRRSMAGCENFQETMPIAVVPAVEAVSEVEFRDDRAYEIEQKVRDYEIDRYGLVHLAVYAQYCQHARHELLHDVGFSADSVAKTGNSLAMSEITTKIRSPLRSGDRYLVRVIVRKTTAARILVDTYVYRLPNKELVVEASGTAVYLDKDYKPTRIPDDMKSKLLRYTAPISNSKKIAVSIN